MKAMDESLYAIHAWALEVVGKYEARGNRRGGFNILGSLAVKCESLNNWHAVNAFINVFSHFNIQESQEWSTLDEEFQDFYVKNKETFSNQSKLDIQMEKLECPCVPVLDYFRYHLDQITKENPFDYLGDGIINLPKFKRIGAYMLKFGKLQTLTYNIIPCQQIQDFFSFPRVISYIHKSYPTGVQGALIDITTFDTEYKGLIQTVVHQNISSRFDLFPTNTDELLDPRIRDVVRNFFPTATVSIWTAIDNEGYVSGSGLAGEINLHIVRRKHDKTRFLVSYRETASVSDLAVLLKQGTLYFEHHRGYTIGCVLVTKSINQHASNVAAKCNIRIIKT